MQIVSTPYRQYGEDNGSGAKESSVRSVELVTPTG